VRFGSRRDTSGLVPVKFWGPIQPRVITSGVRHAILGAVLGVLILPLLAAGIFAGVRSDLQGQDLADGIVEALSGGGGGVLLGLALLWTGLLTGVGLAARVHPGGFRALVGWSVRRVDLAWGVAVVVGALLVGAAVQYLILPLLGVESSEDLGNTGTFTGAGGLYLIPIFLAVGVIGPLVEELFFRGLLLQVLQDKYGAAIAVIISALTFGLMHAQATLASSLYTVLFTAALGAVFAILRIRTGRLGPAIAAHMMFNTVNLTLAFALTAS
jgi:membrane protease YdiL (CAAX protease family)